MALLMALLIQSGCKENTLIHSKVLPANDTAGLKTYTLSCVTHTYYDNAAITSTSIGGIPAYQGVGVFNDPFFGTMTGATYFQLLYPEADNPFTGMTIDSAFLILPYSGFTYGDSTNQTLTQTYQVFYIQDTLGAPYYTNYYASSTKPVDLTNPLSDPVTVNLYQLKDSFGYNILPVNNPGLRIKLRIPALMNYLTPALNVLSTSTNLPNDFFTAFHGICVMPTNTKQGTTAMPYFQLNNNGVTNNYDQAGILIYDHTPGTTLPAGDTAVPYLYYFDPGTCAHFNNITRSYSRYPVNALLHSAQANDSIIVLQNQPGASFDIVIPGILSIPKGAIINNAQLQISLLPATSYYSDTAAASLPERLYPTGIANTNYPSGVGNGQAYTLADRYPITSITPISYMDGFFHYFTYGSTTLSTYTINIPREVMTSIAANNDTLHLHISGTEDFYGAFKLVAAGGSYSNPLYQPKLIVVYSNLK